VEAGTLAAQTGLMVYRAIFFLSRQEVTHQALRQSRRGTELEFVIMVIAVSCVKLLSAHNSTQHTSRSIKCKAWGA
jgi:hypothetical protein